MAQGFAQIDGAPGSNRDKSKHDQPPGHTVGSSLQPFFVQ
jgi:hypothetical protein